MPVSNKVFDEQISLSLIRHKDKTLASIEEGRVPRKLESTKKQTQEKRRKLK